MMDVTIYRKDYRPPVFAIEHVDLDFALYDDHALVTNTMHLQRLTPGPLHLFGDELELVSIHIDATQLDSDAYRLEEEDLLLVECPDDFILTIVTRIQPQANTKLSGLYRPHKLFCTQCEAQGFRRITFFLDRPDVLTKFTTRISADKTQYPVLLSNGNLIDSGDGPHGRHWVVWEDPFKKPSYLFALVAGNIPCITDTFTTCSGRTVDLRLYVEPGQEDKGQYALESLKRAMRWDEEQFGREYDLDIYMIVAVSDFNMGAMENKGLNIFNSKYILARPDTATDQDYIDVEGVVGHEYFHNWTGNRVTCRDWFQLSLKEGLTVFRDQEFSQDMGSRDVNRIMDIKVLRNSQFPEDASAMAHPVRPDSYQEINNFYTATVYNKGAEVIRMQQTLLGEAGFRRGMDLYFERHDGQAVTIDDFVAAMEDANDIELTQFKRWYSQAGTPVVDVKTEYYGTQLKLCFTQSCPPTPECKEKKPFHIPIRIALFNAQGQRMPIENEILELRESEQVFYINHIPEKPLVSLLRDFSAPVILNHCLSQDERLALLRFETDGFSKWDVGQQLALGCLKQWVQSPRETWSIPQALLNAYRHVLEDNSIDAALRAELLNPPGFEDLANQLQQADVTCIEAARDAFREQLGVGLFNALETTYTILWQAEDHAMNHASYSRRKLRNMCLWLMMKGNEVASLAHCQRQFKQAKTMSDQLASFALLVNSKQKGISQQAIEDFYQQWQKDELVLDKWFAVQASCELPGTLTLVKTLLSHPAFQIKNPNKVRALIGAFSQANPRHFHAIDGSGYVFLTEMILTMDKINPQITARLATPFTRWKHWDTTRQKLMRQQLEYMSTQDLSKDLRELVTKSLMD